MFLIKKRSIVDWPVQEQRNMTKSIYTTTVGDTLPFQLIYIIIILLKNKKKQQQKTTV